MRTGGRIGGAPFSLSSIRGIVFDIDGTLTSHACLDFAAIRARIGAPPGVNILEHVADVRRTDPARAESLSRAVEAWEDEGLSRLSLQEDTVSTVKRLAAAGVKMGLVTRNRCSVAARIVAEIESAAQGRAIRDDVLDPKNSPFGVGKNSPSQANASNSPFGVGTNSPSHGNASNSPFGVPGAGSLGIREGRTACGAPAGSSPLFSMFVGREVEPPKPDPHPVREVIRALSGDSSVIRFADFRIGNRDADDAFGEISGGENKQYTKDGTGRDGGENSGKNAICMDGDGKLGELRPFHVAMVGDGRDDVLAGDAAGCVTCLLSQTDRSEKHIDAAHWVVASLSEFSNAVLSNVEEEKV